MVLGKYDGGGATSYVEVAKEFEAQYFQLDNWEELAPEDYIGDGTFFARELQYLMGNGYRFIDEGEIWHAVR